ncbi:outer membrane protein (porin) [Collimonas fungivorans Ter331]|uniref:Outer membrane protein (Porin) n=2 Tax=Collimonas fungivorans TaxID=158899 RepID=G0AES7_COLFT|nr:outer membrane protein (porin) [Collimonas fungivorans Ter331]
MNKMLLTGVLASVAGGAMAPVFAEPAERVEIYGRVDLSMDEVRGNGGRMLKQTDNASRFGVRGSEDLGAGWRVLFGIEAGFNADTGLATDPMLRNAYAGVRGGFGTVAVGRLDSSQATGSPLYSQVTRNITFVGHDAGATAIGTRWLNARNRTSNAVGYMSPVFHGFSVRARYHQPDPGDAAAKVRQEGDVKATDIGLNYESGALSAGIGYGQNKRRGTPVDNDFRRKWQLLGSYSFGATKISALYGRDHYNGTVGARSRVNYWLLGFSLPFGAGLHQIAANYMKRDAQGDIQGKGSNFQAGYIFHMSKRTKLYASYDRENLNANKGGNLLNTISSGIQHRF